MLESLGILALVLALFFLAFLLIRTVLFGKVPPPIPETELPAVDGEIVAEHLAAVLRHRTISEAEEKPVDAQAFLNLHRELERLYPRVHATLRVEVVNRLSLLYIWKGKDETLDPVLFAGHLDVVPVDPETRDAWKFPPFDGHIEEGAVWGRGALDTKNSVVAVLEAVETLLKQGYQPVRTILLAFGHDEEIGGFQGAAQIAGRIQAYNTRLAAVLDEGGAILSGGVVPGVRFPVALIGTAEKGYATLQLTVESSGGHSSMPPRHTGIGVLARAITRLENAPFPARLYLVRRMFEFLAPFLPFGLRLAFANLWLFRPLISRALGANPRTNALIRTTTAVTMVQGGVKDNVLPARATAEVNFRLMPGDRVADVVAFARRVIADDAVQINLPQGRAWEASRVSPTDSAAFQGILQALGQVYPEAISAPYLVAGATDARHYQPICEQIYRLSPMMITAEELKTIHSVNEHISMETLARMVQFYIRLIKIWGENG